MKLIPMKNLSVQEVANVGLVLLSVLGLVLGIAYGGNGGSSSAGKERCDSPRATTQASAAPVTTSSSSVTSTPLAPPSVADTPNEAPSSIQQSTSAKSTMASTTSSVRESLPDISKRPDIVREALMQRGGAIGTNGKPAVALRFDHHLNDFGAKVVPLLEKYDLPWGQMLNASSLDDQKSDDNWSWDQLAEVAHNHGGEVWNHGMTHGNFNTREGADYAVTTGLRTLRVNLPTLVVDGWALPGQPTLMGLEGGDTPEKYYDTYPGRLVLGQHAFIRGYFPNPFHPLDGDQLLGRGHVTIDKQTNGRIQGYIRRLLGTENGVTLMLHPNYLDRKGYLTSNELDSAFAYIAHLRDTNQIEVLSPSGILMAKSSLPERHGNLLRGNLAGRLSDYQEEVVEQPTTAGVPHEYKVWVRGDGPFTLKARVSSPTYSYEVQRLVDLSDNFQRVSVVLTPPKDTTEIRLSMEGNGEFDGHMFQPL